MDNKQFEIINKKLDALIKVAGMAACRGLSSEDQAWLLHCAGLSSPEIAESLNSTDIAIRQAIHRRKTKPKTAHVMKQGKHGPKGSKARKKAK
jgi:hypothetical protein